MANMTLNESVPDSIFGTIGARIFDVQLLRSYFYFCSFLSPCLITNTMLQSSQINPGNIQQTLANRGTDSRFVPEAILKALISKLSSSRVIKL